jgi:Transposase DDE domain group 1
LRVNADNDATGPGRIAIRADDLSLTPYAGLAIVGELARRTRLVELIDAELGAVRTARAVKVRRRGLTAGVFAVSLAECQIAGADCFDDIENVRADRAGAPLRAIAMTPSAPAARQLARRYRSGHIRAIERAQARVGERLDRELARDPAEDVSFDLDATETEVYGRKKQGAARSHTGALAYNSYVVTWAQRGRALTSELVGGNRSRISAPESAAMIARATALLPAGHGQVTVRGDSGFYCAALMMALREQQVRFTLSASRTTTMGWDAGQSGCQGSRRGPQPGGAPSRLFCAGPAWRSVLRCEVFGTFGSGRGRPWAGSRPPPWGFGVVDQGFGVPGGSRSAGPSLRAVVCCCPPKRSGEPDS